MTRASDTIAGFPVRRTLLFSSAISTFVFLLSFFLFLQIRQRESEDLKELISQNAVLISETVGNAFSSQVEAIRRMADRWEFRTGTPEDFWRVDAKNYVQDMPGLEMIAWVNPRLEIAWHELKSDGPPNAQFMNFYASPDIRAQIAEARRDKGAVSVFRSVQAGAYTVKLIVLIPLYSGNRFNGFMLGGFDGKSTLDNNLSPLAKKYYFIALQPSENNNPPPSLLPFTESQNIHFKEVTLKINIWPTQSLLNAKHSLLPMFVFMAGGFFALIAGIIFFFIQRILWQAAKLQQQSRSLLESEASFQSLVEGVTDYAIYTLDKDGSIKSWNSGAERIKQYKAKEILGQHFSTFYTPEDCAAHEPENALSIASNTGKYTAEGLRVRKNGERFWASIVIDALRNKKGELIGYVKITRDITNLKIAEKERDELIQKLVDSNGELERFAFIATHDLQEPLRLIHNFSTLLQQNSADEFSDQSRQYIGIIENSAKRMHALIVDLLEYARIGSEPERPESINVSQCVKYVTDTLQVTIQRSGAEIIADRLPVLKGSPVHFSVLLQNLIGNALKYQLPGARPLIHIGAVDKGDEWLFSVEDNGIGMKREYLEQIFEPFKRLHNNEVYFGTGMGLAICRKIVSRMGGRIWVESLPGEGSIFYFTVPGHLQGNASPGSDVWKE